MSNEVGYKKPPADTQFGGRKANKRNNKGRPKDFSALRKLAQGISHEDVTNGKGETVTVVEAILRKWAASNDPRLQMQFVEVAYGKTPQISEVSGPGGSAIEHAVTAKVNIYIPDNGRDTPTTGTTN